MAESPQSPTDETAVCCSAFYEQELVQQLMGDSFHPGGIDLTKRLINRLNLPAKSKVADIACGIGTTTCLLANDFCLNATGIDFSEKNIDRARERLASKNAAPSALAVVASDGHSSDSDCCSAAPGEAVFQQGSADRLPLDDQSLDAVICECAVSTFSDQQAAASEFYRVLKPGGVFAMTDMVVDGELPENVATNLAPWTCMANAHRVTGYQSLFLKNGFSVASYVDESHTLLELATELKRKLVMAGLGKSLGALPGINLDLTEMRSLLTEARSLVDQGTVQYAAIVFSKGKPAYPVGGHAATSAKSCC